MNNKEQFKKSIEKINVDEDLMNKMINQVKDEFKMKQNNVVMFERKNEVKNGEKDVKGDAKNMKKGKIFKIIKTMAISAAAMVVMTTIGIGSYAAISGDTRIFKVFGINLEGIDSNIEVVENSTEFESGVSYTIDYEGSMLLNKKDGVDIYESPYNSPEKEELNVYMKIYTLENTECESLCEELKAEIDAVKDVYDTYGMKGITEVKIGKEDYDATLYFVTDGRMQWDSRIKNVYVVKVEGRQNLIIETSYFSEAEEGWGSIFGALMSTLEIKK